MEKPRRVSIGVLCVVVAVSAVDFAWWKYITAYSAGHKSLLRFPGPALDTGAMPMASFLVVGLAYILSNRGRVPRGFVEFLCGGLAGLVIYMIYNWSSPLWPAGWFYKSMEPIYLAKARWPWLDPPRSNYLYYADLVYYAPPQFLLALIVGLISRKRHKNM